RPAGEAAQRQALALAERLLAVEPDSAANAEQLADLLLESRPTPDWEVLKPTSMTSESGATLALQPDDSVLVSGVVAGHETYPITAPAGLKGIVGLRLEALP